MTLEKYLKREEQQPLTKERLKTYMRRPGLKFIDYADIKQGTSIVSLLGKGKYGGVCILWSSGDGAIGHFTGLFRKGKTIMHFDPTGLPIHRLAQLTSNPFVLQKKLEELKHVTYNRKKFQQIKDNVQSCGRHVLCRWNLLNLSEREYESVMTHRKLSSDDIAVIFTIPNDLQHWSEVRAEESAAPHV